MSRLDAEATTELYGDARFAHHTISDLYDPPQSYSDNPDEPSEWSYVRARVAKRNSPLYNEGIYRIRRATSTSPLVDGTEWVSESDLVDRMKGSRKANYVKPSVCGEYLDVKRVRARETDDGTWELDDGIDIDTIPVEWVIEPLTYDEAFLELVE